MYSLTEKAGFLCVTLLTEILFVIYWITCLYRALSFWNVNSSTLYCDFMKHKCINNNYTSNIITWIVYVQICQISNKFIYFKQGKDIKISHLIHYACMRKLKQILSVYVSFGRIWIIRSDFIYVVSFHTFKKH